MKNAKIVLISLFLSFAYLAVVTVFFQGLGKAKYFDAVPDVFMITLGFIVLLTIFSQKKLKPNRLLILGTSLIVLERLIEIPLQEYQLIQGKPFLEAWIVMDFMFSVGLLILLIRFTKLYE